MNGTVFVPGCARATRSVASALGLGVLAFAVHAQPEVAGQGAMTTGSPVPKNVSVSQARDRKSVV